MKKFIFLLMTLLMAFAFDGLGQIISQYIETNTGTTPKGIEIWNNTTSDLDFSTNALEIKKGVNGAAPAEDYTLITGTLAVGEVIVIGTSDLEAITTTNGSAFYLKPFTFNGDDALEVWYGTTKIDVFGEPGVDPGSAWTGNGVSTANQNIQLLAGITAGDTDGWTDPSLRFETVSTDPAVDGGVGFGIAPSTGGNQNPNITNIVYSPLHPTSSDAVTVYGDVTDVDGTISTVTLSWGTTSGSLTSNISMTDPDTDDTYTTVSDIPAQADGTTVYFEIVALDNEAGSTTSAEQSYFVHDAATTTLPYSENFASGFGDIYPISVAGQNVWEITSEFAQCSGFGGGNPEEDWMILPGINLDNYSNEYMNFDSKWQFGTNNANNYLKLYYSTDYPGTGDPDPTIYTWTELSFTMGGDGDDWLASGDINLSGISGTSVYIGFKYFSTDSEPRWDVDNISIQEATTTPEPNNHPTDFTATTNDPSAITNNWIDATGTQLPTGYLVLANLTGTFSAPDDGTPVSNDTDMSDGEGAINVSPEFKPINGPACLHQHHIITSYILIPIRGQPLIITDGSPPEANATTDDPSVLAGDIIITEVMQNPSDVGDSDGEWFEVFNSTGSVIDIEGWTLTDNGTNSHSISGTVNIPAGGFAVLGIKSTTDANGGVPVDYQYSSYTLGNGTDAIILTSNENVEVDKVEWDGGTNWPDPAGKSMTYTGSSTEDNNVGSKWIEGIARENGYTDPVGGETDQGSPKTNGLYQNLITATTWTGTGNWSEGNSIGSSDWSNGSPGSMTNVTVDGALTIDLDLATPAICNDLDLLAGASLIVSPNKGLTVNGDLTMDITKGSRASTVTIESSADGNGSIIIQGLTGDYLTVERYIPAYTNDDDGWHLIASPVDMMNVGGSNFEPGDNDDLYKWDEVNSMWDNYKNNGWDLSQFYSGEGYLASYQVTSTKDFYGLLMNMDWDLSNLSVTTGKGEGWHLLGNPFSSTITWNQPSVDWGLNNVGGVAKVWDEAASNYTDIGAGNPIPSTNGFFVQATDGSNGLTIPASARTHNAQNNYKAGVLAETNETLKLTVTNDGNTFYDVTRIGFRHDAIEAWDIEFDSHKLFGRSSAPQLWTITNDDHFSWNNLPYQTEAYQVPMNFRAGINATYEISAEGVQSFYESSEIYLEDLFTEKLIHLQKQPLYSFAATTEDAENRFILHFHGVISIGEVPAIKDALVYSHNKTVYIKFNQIPKNNFRVEVFNTLGQQVAVSNFTPARLMQLMVNEKPGIYIVRLYSDNRMVVQKVLIK